MNEVAYYMYILHTFVLTLLLKSKIHSLLIFTNVTLYVSSKSEKVELFIHYGTIFIHQFDLIPRSNIWQGLFN